MSIVIHQKVYARKSKLVNELYILKTVGHGLSCRIGVGKMAIFGKFLSLLLPPTSIQTYTIVFHFCTKSSVLCRFEWTRLYLSMRPFWLERWGKNL